MTTSPTGRALSAAATACLSRQALTGWECASCGCARSTASIAWWTRSSTCVSRTGGNASSSSTAMPASGKLCSGRWLVVRYGEQWRRPGWVAADGASKQITTWASRSHVGKGSMRVGSRALRRGQRCGAVWPGCRELLAQGRGLLVLDGAQGWGWQGRVICPVYPAFRWGGTDLWAWICTATMPDQRPENGHGTDGTDVNDLYRRRRASTPAPSPTLSAVRREQSSCRREPAAPVALRLLSGGRL